MKVCHLTSAHQRTDTRIFLKECTSLARYGYSVNLVVADGKGDEVKNGVAIHDAGASNGRLNRMCHAPGRVLSKALFLDADLYHIHDPELIPIGLALKKKKKKVIFDIHENTDLQILEKKWIPSIFRKPIALLYSQYENFACRRFDYLLVPQICMKDKFSNYSKTEIIANFPEHVPEDYKRSCLNRYSLLYSGGLGEARGLWNMLDLIDLLSTMDNRYKLTLIGPISDGDLEKAKLHSGWRAVEYLGVLSKDEVYAQYKKNSIGLILFNNVGQYYMAYALKLFEYMQSGMLVLMPNFGDWNLFNEQYKVGFNVDTSNAGMMAKLINDLGVDELNHFSFNNTELVNSDFTWETQEKKLIEIYSDLLNGE
jgi:glycosyltransferase involved in cell wall biosynthesis